MKLELCAASIEAIQLAKKYQFDRIELCQNLEQGGITPFYGMIEYAIAYGIDTHVLIRPRPGGFQYTQEEAELMIREVTNCREMGAKGVVFGALTEVGEIDRKLLEKVIEKAKGMEVTFHRAFDDTFDWKKAMDVLIQFGVHRILTSGLARNVEQGLPILKEMVNYANEKIEIMPGGGVNAGNVKRLMDAIHPDAIHFSATSKVQLDKESLFSESVLQVEEARLKRILNALAS
jgi:copper homeostasis protein